MKRNRLFTQKQEMNGYMTVEASLIIPMILCIFVILIYAAFFLYDRCCFNQDAYILCFRESIRKDEETVRGPDPQKALEGKNRQFGTKYFAARNVSVSSSADREWVRIEGSASTLPPVFGNYFLMPENIWLMRFGSSARYSDPPFNIRAFRRRVFLVSKAAQYIKEHQGVE